MIRGLFMLALLSQLGCIVQTCVLLPARKAATCPATAEVARLFEINMEAGNCTERGLRCCLLRPRETGQKWARHCCMDGGTVTCDRD